MNTSSSKRSRSSPIGAPASAIVGCVAGFRIDVLGLMAPPLCLCCRAPLLRAVRGPALCLACSVEIERTPSEVFRGDGIDAGFGALPYTGTGRSLVAALKFSRLLIAAELGAALIASRVPPGALVGAIVPVPAAPLRSLRRGFDPAWELATSLSGATGLAISPVLRRRDLARQRGRSRADRIRDPPDVVARGPAPEAAVLIDDVITTGATIDACARALRGAGARRVVAIAIAAVPSRERGLGERGPEA